MPSRYLDKQHISLWREKVGITPLILLQRHKAPAWFGHESCGCLCFIASRSGLFQSLIYIEMTSDLYINWKRFIYKSQTIYIFIVNSLYIDCYLVSHKPYFDLKKFVSSYFWLQNPFPFRCLFRIIPNSASLLKTFFAHILGNSREAFAIPCLSSATAKDLNLDCRMSRKGRVGHRMESTGA